MLTVTPTLAIPEELLTERFVQGSGPGGQNVNKVASTVQLWFNVDGCKAIAPDARRRLRKLAGNRLTKEGEILIEAAEHRSRERNRQAARRRLAELIREALVRPKRRRPTKPGRAAKERRLKAKQIRGEKKKLRKPPKGWE